MALKLVAYCNSRWSVGDEMVNGQRVLQYGAWGSEYAPPPLSAVERSPARNQEAPESAFVDMLWRADGDQAKYVTRHSRPGSLALRSGQRKMTAIQVNVVSGHYRVKFACSCGKHDHVSASAWRTGTATSGCRTCRVALKRGAMVQIPREGWQARADREREELRSNPMTVGMPPAARGGKHIWVTAR